MSQSFENYQEILTILSSVIVCTDAEGVIRYRNPAAEAVLGHPLPLGEAIFEVDIAWEKERIAAGLRACAEHGRQERIDDLQHDTPEGLRFLGFTLYPQHGDPGRPAGVIWAGADITERKKLMSQLHQSQKMEAVGQLAAGVAHEINTPIQYISDNLHFLKEAMRDFAHLLDVMAPLLALARTQELANIEEIDDVQEAVDLEFLLAEAPKAAAQCLEGAEQIARIVGAMKNFAHPEMEAKSPVSINRIIQDTLTVSKAEWKLVATAETRLAADLPSVRCIPGLMNQVMLNLIVNAAHALAARKRVEGDDFDGAICCATTRCGDMVEIAVSDNGAGIPEQIRERIFEPFFTTKPVGQGTGQGLAIVHDAIVSKHGGELLCESTEGEGTRFTIRLPIGAP